MIRVDEKNLVRGTTNDKPGLFFFELKTLLTRPGEVFWSVPLKMVEKMKELQLKNEKNGRSSDEYRNDWSCFLLTGL